MILTKFVLLSVIFLLEGCSLVPIQDPFAATPNPVSQTSTLSGTQVSSLPPSGTPPSQVTGSQRGQYLWDKALEGMVMGGSIAGPYGAGGGLIIGLLTGLFTADAHDAQIDSAIQSEHAKDKELEAKIEQEMERQRALEAQVSNGAGHLAQANGAQPVQSPQKPTGAKLITAAVREPASPVASSPTIEPSQWPRSPFKNAEAKDINGDNIPDLWIYYNPSKPGEIVRQEEATHWNGRVDTWSYFKEGKLVKREVDTNGDGASDTVYYYTNDKIAREERDENGTGHVSFRATYQNGRLAKVEKDTNGRGIMDHRVDYDTTKEGENVLREEQDLDGDGTVDVWSYYEEGHLMRRDLSALGLQLLSKQEPRAKGRPEAYGMNEEGAYEPIVPRKVGN